MDELKKDYEIGFLIQNPESVAGVFEVLRKHGAEVYNQGSVNPMRLAYPIKKQVSAHFGFAYFHIEAEKISSMKEELKFLPALLRFLIITPPFRQEAREARSARAPEAKAPEPAAALSNEALEQKLEEILK